MQGPAWLFPHRAMSKVRYPRADALKVAKELCDALRPFTDNLIVAGSLRRRKQDVGDVEILFIPKLEWRNIDLLYQTQISLADEVLSSLLQKEIIRHRPNVNGSNIWGEKNKLAVHVASGIPVDLFTATPANWWNYLVCRTGSAEHNTRIAVAAQARGWKWHPYGSGFTDEKDNLVRVTSEKDIFTYLGLPYLEPWQRI